MQLSAFVFLFPQAASVRIVTYWESGVNPQTRESMPAAPAGSRRKSIATVEEQTSDASSGLCGWRDLILLRGFGYCGFSRTKRAAAA